MKNPVTAIRATIVPFLIFIGLSAGLAGCSSSETRPVAPPPSSNTGTISEAQTASTDEAASRESQGIELKQNHPKQYTVKKGDTLWDISSMFLQDPWYWPEIWQKNPQVKNPHLIYPGDVLTLVYINGRPQILVNQPSGSMAGALPVKKLSPSVRREDIAASIPTIPSDAIRQFTTRPRVVTKEELEQAPYILASDDEHLILGQGNKVYIRGELDKERVRFTVFRPGAELVDPASDEVLGYEAIYAGEVHIKKYDDPAVGELTFTEREVLIGDRLMPLDKSSLNTLYFPKVPDRKLKGQVISLFDALFGIAKYQIAVINIGTRDGIEVGNLLSSYNKGDTVRDDFDPLNSGDDVKLPDERSGLLMVFRAFDNVCYALVMESSNVIHKYDVVATPK